MAVIQHRQGICCLSIFKNAVREEFANDGKKGRPQSADDQANDKGELFRIDAGEPELVHHFLKVYNFAKLIGSMENISSRLMEILEAGAIVHDIGIKVSMEKHGTCNGKLQEQEGPLYAERLLQKAGYEKDIVERVSYLVAHHHTYTNMEGMDYQILVEADFLVNLYENQSDKATMQTVYNKIFKTKAGRKLCRQIYLVSDEA